MSLTQKEKKHRREEIIDFKNAEGREMYPVITDKHAFENKL